jgi:4-amino-4-deoxy-L-arabinose transferase-like glycosyltransferase
MLASGDWLVPRLDGEPRINKPPLYYWAVAATSQLLGGLTTTSLRLPAAASALALVALAFAWGRALGGPAHGLLAAGLLATMKGFVPFGRRGVAEMPLALFCTAALFCYARLRITRRRALLPAFAACLALAILAKATAALLIIGLPIALDLAWSGEWRRALRPRVVAWVTLGLAAGFAWYAVVLARVPQAWDVLVMAATLPLGIESSVVPITTRHYRSALFYPAALPSLALPGLLLLPLALWRAWQTRLWRGDPAQRFPALAFTLCLLAFSLLPQKQRHYLLPLLPLLALWLAEPLAWLLATRAETVRRALRVLAPIAAALGALALAAALGFYAWMGAPAAWLLVLAIGGGAIVAGCAGAGVRARPLAFAAWCALGWLAATGVVRLDYDVHRDMRKRGELGSDAGSRRWERALEQLDRFAARPRGSLE